MAGADELAGFFDEENDENRKVLDDLAAELDIQDIEAPETSEFEIAGKLWCSPARSKP